MANRIRTGDPSGFNKGRSLKFREGSWVRQTPEEGWRIYRPKRCGNNNKDEDNSPETLNDKKSLLLSYAYYFFFWTLTLHIGQHPAASYSIRIKVISSDLVNHC